MKGWIVTAWVDAPDDWDAEKVRQEFADVLDDADKPGLVRNTTYTPKPASVSRLRVQESRYGYGTSDPAGPGRQR